jgi:hypothetical protein
MDLRPGADTGAAPADALVERIRAQRGRMTTRQLVDGAHVVVARLGWSRRLGGRRWLSRTVAPAALMAVVGLAVWTIVRDRTRPIALVVAGGRLAGGGRVEADPRGGATLEFSDGTEVALSPDARTEVRSIDRHGARVVMSAGTAHVDVAHLEGARWFVDAGPFSIHVTGTAFTVSWNPDGERLDVDMERGTVEIDGPLSDRAIPLRSGQHLTVKVRERETVVRERGQPAPETPATIAATTKGPAEDAGQTDVESRMLPRPVLERAGSKATRAARQKAGGADRPERRWAAALAQGQFETIVGEAERIGVDSCLADAGESDLAALADAARYARHTEVARRALAALRARFPDAPAARDAAFLLGRLEETAGAPSKACEWYDRYLSESPAGTYASEALGRDMDLAQATYRAGRAEEIAHEYLRRFPQGTYAARARTIVHGP